MTQALYPISTVSEMTGVNTVTLRAWERRYGLIEPSRSEGGRRLYSDADIERIHTVLEMMAEGMTISGAAEVLRRAVMADETADSPQGPWPGYQAEMVEAIGNFDDLHLEQTYTQVMSLYPVELINERLLMPLLHTLGERWASGEGSVAEEHFFSVFMRNKLGARFHHRNQHNNGPSMVAACLPGESHEFGLLLFSLMAHTQGYRVVLLGANLPLEELPKVVERTQSEGVILSGSIEVDCSRLYNSLRNLVTQVSVPVFIGGATADNCRDVIENTGCIAAGRDLKYGLNIINQHMG
ncbi:MAG: MerR family transcriptional regulator [Gammaproteobacteria bacterium]|nr:MerR family transcriptional regulator [Gammaproteobacteria bacterium]